MCYAKFTINSSLENGRILAEQIPGAKFKIYPNTGHLFFVEQALPVNDDLHEFFCSS